MGRLTIRTDMMVEALSLADLLALATIIADRERADRLAHGIVPTVTPIAATLSEAHFRAESEQRPIMTIACRSPVVIYPIGARPA